MVEVEVWFSMFSRVQGDIDILLICLAVREGGVKEGRMWMLRSKQVMVSKGKVMVSKLPEST
jgi:hypothetical protein